jgi:hypothetical protein
LTLGPSETRHVQFVIDLTPGEKHLPAASRLFTLSISPRLGDDHNADSAFWWDLRGRVRHALSIDPPSVDFGHSLQRGLPFGERTAAIRTHYRLGSLQASCDPVLGSVLVQDDAHGDTAKLVIKPAASLPDGDFEFPITVQGTHGGQPLPPAYLRVRGTVLSIVRAEPARLEFGLCAAGTTVADSVILKSAVGQPFEIVCIETDNDDTVAVPGWLPGSRPTSGELPFNIIHKLTHNGSHVSTVGFTTRTKDGHLSRLKVPIHAHSLD